MRIEGCITWSARCARPPWCSSRRHYLSSARCRKKIRSQQQEGPAKAGLFIRGPSACHENHVTLERPAVAAGVACHRYSVCFLHLRDHGWCPCTNSRKSPRRSADKRTLGDSPSSAYSRIGVVLGRRKTAASSLYHGARHSSEWNLNGLGD
jgi:hypothetical protein